MIRKGLPQEGLKLIACAAMLLDHIGAFLFPGAVWLRIVGRMAFPIYCFLLAEGMAHTRGPGRYALRLLICTLLSEIPYDLTSYGCISWAGQSVMVTLLLGFAAICLMSNTGRIWLKMLIALPAILAAELAGSDYGAMGMVLILTFYLTRDIRCGIWIQGEVLLTSGLLSDSAKLDVAGIAVPVQVFGLLALLLIAAYSGHKVTSAPWIRWGFYLFYPIHLLALWVIATIL